jgi:hypothetical protein
MFSDTVDKLLSNPEFMRKVASQYPNATRAALGASHGMSGDLNSDLHKVASYIGAKSYFQRRERAMINSGLVALSEIENG